MAKKLKKILLPILVCLFFFSSCNTSQSLTKLQPKDSAVRWENGYAYISDSIYGVSYQIAFTGITDSQYVFDFHVINQSNMTYVVDPASFYYRPCNESMQDIGYSKVPAIDPGKEMSRINKGLAKTETRRKNQFGIALLAIGADIFSSIVMSNNYNPHDNFVRDAVSGGVQTAIIASAIANDAEADNLTYEKQKYSNAVIRKTTLNSNYSVSGKVFFPVTTNSSYIRIYVPVDNNLIMFTFKQTQQ